MPRNSGSLALEQRHADELTRIRRRIGRELARLTTALDSTDLVAAIESYLPMAARLVAAGQLEAQQAAASFVASYLAAETEEPSSLPVIAGDIAGRTSVGISLASVLASSVGGGVFSMLSSGHTVPVALRYAAAAATRLAQGEIAAAADREVANQATQIRSRAITTLSGWVWVLTGRENCAACLSRADGRVRPFDESMPRHPGCDCVRGVRLVDDPGTFADPTGEERFRSLSPDRQAAQFRTAGKEKAELVRSGQLTLADLVKVERHANWRTIVTERPLAEVVVGAT